MSENPWEAVFREEGHVFTEVPDVISDFTALLQSRNLQRGKLLDVGCGNGRFLVHFARLGYRVTGTDSAPTALQLANEWLQRENLNAELLQHDFRSTFPFDDGYFDTVVSIQAIHHALLETVRGTITEVTRVVRPGGLILISVPVFHVLEDGEKKHASEEIEYHTFVPGSGIEKGLPHHLFTLKEFGASFPDFEVLSLKPWNDDRHIVLVGEKRSTGKHK